MKGRKRNFEFVQAHKNPLKKVKSKSSSLKNLKLPFMNMFYNYVINLERYIEFNYLNDTLTLKCS